VAEADIICAESAEPAEPGPALAALNSSPRKDPSAFEQFMDTHRYFSDIIEDDVDEYERYIAADHHFIPKKNRKQMPKPKPIDLCEFWALHENEYPSLARMAFDILSIPAMSAECERVFSSTKLLLTDRRARMKEDIIEASECLRAWFKRFEQ
jgi:hypothetical protein